MLYFLIFLLSSQMNLPWYLSVSSIRIFPIHLLFQTYILLQKCYLSALNAVHQLRFYLFLRKVYYYSFIWVYLHSISFLRLLFSFPSSFLLFYLTFSISQFAFLASQQLESQIQNPMKMIQLSFFLTRFSISFSSSLQLLTPMKFPIPFLPPFYDLFYGCSNQPIKASQEQRTYLQSKSYFIIFYLFHQTFPFSFLISLNQLKPSLISIWIIHFSSFVFWVLALKFIIITITLPLMKFYLFILPSTFTFSLDNILQLFYHFGRSSSQF